MVWWGKVTDKLQAIISCLSHVITGYVPLILQAYLLYGVHNPHVTELWQW